MRDFSKKGLNFVEQLFNLEGKLKNWTAIKNEYFNSRIQEFSVDAIGRYLRETLETIHKRTKYKFE